MTELEAALKADRVAYLQDLAAVHFDWAGRFFALGEAAFALESWSRFRKVVDAIDREMTGIAAAVEAATAELGGLTMLVNNAGAFETVPLEEITAEQWDAIFATNTRAPLLVAQAALPHLRAHTRSGAGTGRILNIGSLGGQHAWATHAHYCAPKAALHMLTLTMAKAFAPEIAVNCVAPGMIATGETSSDTSAYAHFIAKTPMGRNGTPADVAEAVLFLAGATPFLTGQILTVDGGLGL